MAGTSELLAALAEYRDARKRLLAAIRCPSNRHPLTEFAERLVEALTGGTLAERRTQAGWDVELPDGSKVQVKSLTNSTSSAWVNEHPIRFGADVDWYAIVILEDFTVAGVLMFPCRGLAPIGAALGQVQ